VNFVPQVCQEASPLTWVFPDLSGSSPPGRLLHGAVLDNNGTLWVTGGTGSSDSSRAAMHVASKH